MSRGKIYLITDGQALQPMEEQSYEQESLFQELLEQYPDLLAGEQIDAEHPRRWLLISREFGIPDHEEGASRWSLDHLFLDQDGVPTLVEVKRSSDTRIRREVVGQMLDYAANCVVYWPVDKIRTQFEACCNEQGIIAQEKVCSFIGSDEVNEDTAEAFWGRVKTNFQAQRIRMIFVADVIPPELRRIVEFLNQQMDPAEVLAVEIRQFVGGNVKTLVPRVFGQTAEAGIRKGTKLAGKQWDETSFFAELETKGGLAVVPVARRILEWAKPKTSYIYWGKGGTAGSFIPVLKQDGARHQFFTVHTGWSSNPPGVETAFQYQANKPPFDNPEKRRQLLERFNRIPGVSLPADSIDRRPSIPLTILVETAALEEFLAVMQWYVDEVTKSGS